MKRRDWLRSAAMCAGISAISGSSWAEPPQQEEFPDGPDDDYSPAPPAYPRVAPRATIQGGGRRVRCAALSADGLSIAVALEKEKVFKIWDAAGRERLASGGHAGYVMNLAFSPEGKSIISSAAKGSISQGEREDPTF